MVRLLLVGANTSQQLLEIDSQGTYSCIVQARFHHHTALDECYLGFCPRNHPHTCNDTRDRWINKHQSWLSVQRYKSLYTRLICDHNKISSWFLETKCSSSCQWFDQFSHDLWGSFIWEKTLQAQHIYILQVASIQLSKKVNICTENQTCLWISGIGFLCGEMLPLWSD